MLDYTGTHCIERELLLAKVSILGPEYLEEQLVGGPTHEPRRISHSHTAHRPAEHAHEQSKQEREAALVHQFEHSADPSAYPDAEADPAVPLAEPLTPSQALRLKSDNLQAIQTLSAQFGGRAEVGKRRNVDTQFRQRRTRFTTSTIPSRERPIYQSTVDHTIKGLV